MSGDNTSLYYFCERLPKVELHAHLNGSLSKSTIKELQQLDCNKGKTSIGALDLNIDPHCSLSACFNVFKQIHDLVTSKEAIVLCTTRVIEEFAKDQVKYLELRTTPKTITAPYPITKSEYIESVIWAIQNFSKRNSDIIVKLLISIDRSKGIHEAIENVQLANKFAMSSNLIVIGLDLSGDPLCGDAREFIPMLQYGKNSGLKISTHLAEIPNQNEETLAILESVFPDRIGHGTYLHPSVGGSKAIMEFVTVNKTPLELCLTSNISSGTVKNYHDHHFLLWQKHPLAICTDDKGLFNTSLSKEYYLLSENFSIPKTNLFDISFKSVNYIFDSNAKVFLVPMWSKFHQ